MKRTLLIAALTAFALAGGILAARAWRARVMVRLEGRAFDQTGRLLRDGHALEALAVLDEQVRSDARFPWGQLEINALVAARQIHRLVAIHARNPQRVLAHEEASLLMARAFFAARQRADYTRVRQAWRGHETRPELWLALDSDVLGLEGQPREAERTLRTQKFTGEAEAIRLVRLALHAVPRSLYESWCLLDQAYAIAPRNSEVRSFRAQILESLGRTAEARVEYVAAHVADPKNPLLRDELAEFYRRQGSYELALQTWREALAFPAPDFIALKEAFWSRIVEPRNRPTSTAPLAGGLVPLVAFIRSLDADRFWDEAAFRRLLQNERFSRERPEVYWLQLLELLRTGHEPDAADLLRANRFGANSWRPDLEVGLARILRFRERRSLTGSEPATAHSVTNRHPFLQELAQRAKLEGDAGAKAMLPPALAGFLNGRQAFAGACLAAGWREAALRLSPVAGDVEVPSWYAFGRAQSLRLNRGNSAALDYLVHQPRTPELVLLRGEILLGESRLVEARQELAAVATEDSGAGYRAAWLLAESYLETREPLRAREIIERQNRLAQATAGREALAKIALATGQPAEAERIYQIIAADSIAARAYLAQRAVERHDWSTARQHTLALQKRLPDELQLRENLLAITAAEIADTHAHR